MVSGPPAADTRRMISVENVTKRYGEKVAVDDLSFQVKPGIVTGFLGPNGAGKSTTMRLMLGLDAPTAGSATIDGRSYLDLEAPLHEVGAMLEARAIHTGRSAYNHLLALAETHGIGRARVQAVRGRDYPVVQGIVFVFGFIVVVVSFFADLVSGWIDPRTGRA